MALGRTLDRVIGQQYDSAVQNVDEARPLPKVVTPQVEGAQDKKGFVRSFGESVINPAKRYTGLVASGLIQAPVSAVTGGRVNTRDIGIGMADEDLRKFQDPRQAAIEGTKRAIGGMSYFVPGGAGGSLAKSAGLFGLAGGMQALSEEDATPGSVAVATGLGALLAPVGHFGSKALGNVGSKLFNRAPRIKAPPTLVTDIPEVVDRSLYNQLPASVRRAVGLGTKEVKEAIKNGETVPMPRSLRLRLEQINKGGISVLGSKGNTLDTELSQMGLFDTPTVKGMGQQGAGKLEKAVGKMTYEVAQEAGEPTYLGKMADKARRFWDAAQKNYFQQTATSIRKQGKTGAVVADMMEKVRMKADLKAANDIEDFGQLIRKWEKDGLKDKELVAYLDQGVEPTISEVKAVGDKVRRMLDKIADQAEKLGIETTELQDMGYTKQGFKRLEHYFPHIFTDMSQFDNPTSLQDIYRRMVEQGSAKDMMHAQEIVQKFVNKNKPRKFGSIDFNRTANVPGWEQNPLTALSIYFNRAHNRLEAARAFGPRFENLLGKKSGNTVKGGIYEAIREEGGDSKFVASVVERVYGKNLPTLQADADTLQPGVGSVREHILPALGSLQTFKLGLSAITNLGQSVNTSTKGGMRNLLKGIASGFTAEGREFSRRSAATLESTMREIVDLTGSGNMGAKFLNAVKFTASEKFNRIVSSNAGKHFAEEEFAKAINGKGSRHAMRQLEDWGIDTARALRRGYLSQDDLLKAGYGMTKDTQFFAGAQDLPYIFGTPEGKVIFQFKAFAFKHGQFIKKEVIDEAIKYKNYKPLMRLLVYSQLIGEPLADIKAAVRGKDPLRREDFDSIPERMWANWATVGAFGIMYDMLESIKYGRLPEFILGPSAGDVVEFSDATYRLMTEGNPDKLAESIVRRVPVIGPALKNTVLEDSKAEKPTEPVVGKVGK